MKPLIWSIPKHIIKFNNNLMISELIPMYASGSLRRLLMPLLFALTQSCKTLSFPSVSPICPRRFSTQLRLSTLLQRTSLPSSMGPVKVHLLITHYIDQNESFLFFKERMSLNGFINVTSILMLRRLLSMINLNWPLII